MKWAVFSSSLPSTTSSSPRVTLWRRLRRLGAVSPTGGLHVLPARSECLEAFQWLAQEVRQAGGEALVLHVEQFEGLTDQQVIDLFRAARKEEYAELDTRVSEVEQSITAGPKREDRAEMQEVLTRLRRRYADIARVDYFDTPEGKRINARLMRLEESLRPKLLAPEVELADRAMYQGKRWVTRPRPHVDRLACAWLIRRYIDPMAVIRYSPRPEPDEVAFDMSEGQFGHRGNLCTFETMIRAFGLQESGINAMAEIVHEIDLQDGLYARPETEGIDAVLKGWLVAGFPDAELEEYGIRLFEGLYAWLSTGTPFKAPRGGIYDGRTHGEQHADAVGRSEPHGGDRR